MEATDWNTPVRSYKSYKNEFFNKYKERQRSLIKNIDSTSLTDDDKRKLKNALKDILIQYLH